MKQTTICFLVKDDKIFLAEKKRGFGQGFLNGYGGKVLESETPEAAAVREVSEEAGIMLNQHDLEKMVIIQFPLWECHIFFVKSWIGDPKESEEMAHPEWYDREHMPYERMWESDREWLPLIFSGKKIRGKTIHKEGMEKMDHFEYEALEMLE